jgi:hypothetical protein
MAEFTLAVVFMGLCAVALIAIIVAVAVGARRGSAQKQTWKALAKRRGWTLEGNPRLKGTLNPLHRQGAGPTLWDLNTFVPKESGDDTTNTVFDAYNVGGPTGRFGLIPPERFQQLKNRPRNTNLVLDVMSGGGPSRFDFDPNGCTGVSAATAWPSTTIAVASNPAWARFWTAELAAHWQKHTAASAHALELVFVDHMMRLRYEGVALQDAAALEAFADLGLACIEAVQKVADGQGAIAL